MPLNKEWELSNLYELNLYNAYNLRPGIRRKEHGRKNDKTENNLRLGNKYDGRNRFQVTWIIQKLIIFPV